MVLPLSGQSLVSRTPLPLASLNAMPLITATDESFRTPKLSPLVIWPRVMVTDWEPATGEVASQPGWICVRTVAVTVWAENVMLMKYPPLDDVVVEGSVESSSPLPFASMNTRQPPRPVSAPFMPPLPSASLKTVPDTKPIAACRPKSRAVSRSAEPTVTA